MQGVLNILWFVAGHISLGVISLAWARHTGMGDERDHPFWKDGFKHGVREGQARGEAHRALLQHELRLCIDRLDGYERALKEIRNAR